MQMILNAAETKEYLRLKSIADAINTATDINETLDSFEKKLEYFYFTHLVPVHERGDLKKYPERPKVSETVAENTTRVRAKTLLDMTSELRAALKIIQNNNTH